MEDKYAQKNIKLRSVKLEQHKTQANKPTEKISCMKMPNRTCAALRVHEQVGNKKDGSNLSIQPVGGAKSQTSVKWAGLGET